MARSTGGTLMAWPQLERAPLMHWMAERSNENVRRQRSQDMAMVNQLNIHHCKWRHARSLYPHMPGNCHLCNDFAVLSRGQRNATQ